MPRYANVRTTALHRLLIRMGFIETPGNHHRNYRHDGLGLRTRMSFGNKEIRPGVMGDIITKDLRMTVDEFREAMNGGIPERFTNPQLWNS